MSTGDDDGHAIAYQALERDTPVRSSDGVEVGRVERVLGNEREQIFDGIVFRDEQGVERFVDAPDVARIAERRVTLALPAEKATALGPPEPGTPVYHADVGAGRLRRLFGGGWRRRR